MRKIVLILILALTCFSSTVQAKTTETVPAKVYEGEIAGFDDTSANLIDTTATNAVQPTAVYEASSEADAIAYARSEMVKRSKSFSFSLEHSLAKTPKKEIDYIMREAMSHTKKPKEGDYLSQITRWEMKSKYLRLEEFGVYESTFTLTMTYYTDASQESMVDDQLKRVMPSLNLGSLSEEGKIRAIHDYICSNVTYDRASSALIRHSAYSALVEGKAVCEGYSSLFYRMCLEAGIDCRIILGKADNEDHAWNIVKLGSYYYNIDVTWDENLNSYKYYLKNNADFSDHKPDTSESKSPYFNDYTISPTSWSGSTASVAVTSVSLNKSSLSLKVGNSETLTATISPSNATNKAITWSSSNTAVATVNNGKVTGVKAGSAKITATSNNGKSSSCTVTVTANSSTTPTPTPTPAYPACKANGFCEYSGKKYWYENWIRQGTLTDPKNVVADGLSRGREIYDGSSDGWYWLDAKYEGAAAFGKEVWVPYIHQQENSWTDQEKRNVANGAEEGMREYVYQCMKSGQGKWVRYDENGKMCKGWIHIVGRLAELYPNQKNNWYYYDSVFGLMAKGRIQIDGSWYYFDEITGVLKQ